jgi:hypothetical protein
VFKRATLKNHGARNNKHSSVDADVDWSLIVYSRALKNIDTTQKILFPFKHTITDFRELRCAAQKRKD